jgi:RNA polymerase sigma-70 factor (ECF subfamily)
LTREDDIDFTALVQRQSRFVFRVAYAVLLNPHDAEDAVQETFLKLYRNGGWRQVDNERAFLARVAWRIAVDRRSSGPQLVTCTIEPDPPSSALGPEQAVIASNQHAVLHSLIDTLPEDLRVALVLSAVDELNSRAVGAILGIPDGTVRTRVQKARQILRQKLAAIESRYKSGDQPAREDMANNEQETRYV